MPEEEGEIPEEEEEMFMIADITRSAFTVPGESPARCLPYQSQLIPTFVLPDMINADLRDADMSDRSTSLEDSVQPLINDGTMDHFLLSSSEMMDDDADSAQPLMLASETTKTPIDFNFPYRPSQIVHRLEEYQLAISQQREEIAALGQYTDECIANLTQQSGDRALLEARGTQNRRVIDTVVVRVGDRDNQVIQTESDRFRAAFMRTYGENFWLKHEIRAAPWRKAFLQQRVALTTRLNARLMEHVMENKKAEIKEIGRRLRNSVIDNDRLIAEKKAQHEEELKKLDAKIDELQQEQLESSGSYSTTHASDQESVDGEMLQEMRDALEKIRNEVLMEIYDRREQVQCSDEDLQIRRRVATSRSVVHGRVKPSSRSPDASYTSGLCISPIITPSEMAQAPAIADEATPDDTVAAVPCPDVETIKIHRMPLLVRRRD